MDLKKFLNYNCFYPIFLFIIMTLSGCSLITGGSPTLYTDEIPAPVIIDAEPDSRMIASHSLTREGYELLSKGDYDGAIRILERAVGINPADGPGYYYLAEAWAGKKNYSLALQFNRLAVIYLKKDSQWSRLADNQKDKIKANLSETIN